MLNREDIVDEFCELVQVNSLSCKERHVAELLAEKLKQIGFSVEFDNADEALGGDVGNLIAKLPATAAERPTIMLQSHMDTVSPGEGIEPVVEGDQIHSAGETILAADAKAGITVILNGLREVIQHDIPHGELQVVFCIAEEIGLKGAKHLDYGKIDPDFCLVFDGGKQAGTMTTAAPSSYKMEFEIRGRAAHAGVRPEAGINAIYVAAQAISRMRLGRIDDETTANVGVIEGGQASNIVPELCQMTGEARSHDDEKLDRQLEHMKMCLAHAAEENGAEFRDPEVEASYRRFALDDDEPIVQIASEAARAAGLEAVTEVGGGGSDANVFNEHGIPAIICATGAEHAHTCQETLHIEDMMDCCRWLIEIIRMA